LPEATSSAIFASIAARNAVLSTVPETLADMLDASDCRVSARSPSTILILSADRPLVCNRLASVLPDEAADVTADVMEPIDMAILLALARTDRNGGILIFFATFHRVSHPVRMLRDVAPDRPD
jgi:hypothetical protein